MLYLVYAFMFICSLAMILYTAALGVKLSVRLRNPMSRILLALLIPAGAALPGVALSMLSQNVCDPYFMSAQSCAETGGVTLTWVHRTLIGWTAAAGLGSLIVLATGFQSRGWTPASNDWHAEGLFFRAVIAMVLTVALFFGADTLVTRELKSELAWYQKLYDWTEPLPPERGEESRKAYIEAYTAMKRIFGTPEEETGNLPEWWEEAIDPYSEFKAGTPEVSKFLWDNKDIYALIANAAAAPALDMTTEELNSYLPASGSTMVKMLSISARANAERGWFVSSMRDIRNMLKIEHHHRSTMGMLGRMLSMLFRGLALDALEEAISKPGFYGTDPVHYPELDEVSNLQEFRVLLRRQHAGGMTGFLSKLTVPAVKQEGQAERFKRTLYRVVMSRHALDCLKTAHAKEEKTLSDGPISLEGLRERLGDCKVYMSANINRYLESAITSATSHGAELALAAVKYYRKNKRYPAEISELAPSFIDSIPPDPYDDKGTMAMADEDGVLLFYSPGYEKFKGERLGFSLKKL